MTQNVLTVKIELLGFWRSGTGQGQAAQLDALCLRDPQGCPYLPGRHLKGLFRDAARRLNLWDGKKNETVLFGEWGFHAPGGNEEDPVPYRGAKPGSLAFSDARMAPDERAAFDSDPKARALLFQTMRATALENGVAKNTSLRAEEVALPVTLFGEIEWIAPSAPQNDWRDTLQAAAPLIRAVGAGRMRGLGRAMVTVHKETTT